MNITDYYGSPTILLAVSQELHVDRFDRFNMFNQMKIERRKPTDLNSACLLSGFYIRFFLYFVVKSIY